MALVWSAVIVQHPPQNAHTQMMVNLTTMEHQRQKMFTMFQVQQSPQKFLHHLNLPQGQLAQVNMI